MYIQYIYLYVLPYFKATLKLIQCIYDKNYKAFFQNIILV